MEILVEPFKENDPGPHVIAAVDAARAAGLDVDMGPFGFDAGATSIQLRVEIQ